MAVPHTGLLWSTTVPRRGAEAASSWLSLELELERVVSLQGARRGQTFVTLWSLSDRRSLLAWQRARVRATYVCARGSWQPVCVVKVRNMKTPFCDSNSCHRMGIAFIFVRLVLDFAQNLRFITLHLYHVKLYHTAVRTLHVHIFVFLVSKSCNPFFQHGTL